jgi:hypothetical protein
VKSAPHDPVSFCACTERRRHRTILHRLEQPAELSKMESVKRGEDQVSESTQNGRGEGKRASMFP